jgi:putative FmdB family regulatory protein
MALYEYLCPACREGFELMRPMSDAHKSATCPVCGSEAQRIISGTSSAENPIQAPSEHPRNDSETGSPDSEAGAANHRSGMIPASDLEGSTGPHGGPSGGSVREDLDSGNSLRTAVHTPMAVREDIAADSKVDLQGDTVPLDMPWLMESQPGGGNLWYIRDWGIASMFGYLRDKWGTEPVGKRPSLAGGTDTKLAGADEYHQTPGQQKSALVEADLTANPADVVDGHPTASEWRNAISIMPWLEEMGTELSEADKENPDMAGGESDMPGLGPLRHRAKVHLSSARGPYSRPAEERMAADFPDQVVEAAWRRQGGRCAGCGRRLIWSHRDRESGTGAWESHHRIPVDRGGSHLLANCVLFCSGAADCHFIMGHGGIGWTHYAPLHESVLRFLSAGSATVTGPATPNRPKRSLLREVLGIPQPGGGRGKPRGGSSGRAS